MNRHKKFPLPKPVKVEIDIDDVPNLATETATLPQLEAWNKEIITSISECTSSRDVKTFLNILKKYIKFLKKDYIKCWDRVAFIKAIQRHVMAMGDYFSAHTENVKYEFDYAFYITKIIGMYCTLELEVHRNALSQVSSKCDFVTSVTNRLLGLMFVSLNFTSGRVSDVLLRIEYSRTNKFHAAVMTRLYHHCLLAMPLETTSYPAFYSYYLNFEDMQQLTPKHLRAEQKKYLLQSFGKSQEEVKDDVILKKILETPSRSTVKTVEHIAFPRKRTTRTYFKYLQSTQTCHVPSDRNISDMMESVGITSEGDTSKSLNFQNTFNFTNGILSSSESESESEQENIVCEIDIDSDVEITYVKKQPPKRKERHKKKYLKRGDPNSKKSSLNSSEVIVLDSSEEEEEVTPVPPVNVSIFGSDNYTQSTFNQIEYAALTADFTAPEFHHGLITPPRERGGLFDDNHIIGDERDCEEHGIFEGYNENIGFDTNITPIENTMEIEPTERTDREILESDLNNEIVDETVPVLPETNESSEIVQENKELNSKPAEISESQEDPQDISYDNINENTELVAENISTDSLANNSDEVDNRKLEENSTKLFDQESESDALSNSANSLRCRVMEEEYEADDITKQIETSNEEFITSEKVAEIIYGKSLEKSFSKENADLITNQNEFTERDSPQNLYEDLPEQIGNGVNIEQMDIEYDYTSDESYTITGGNVTANESLNESIDDSRGENLGGSEPDLTEKIANDKTNKEESPRVLYTSTVEEFDKFEARINQGQVDQFAESCSEIDAFLSGPIDTYRASDQYYGDNDLPAGDLFALVNNTLKDVLPHFDIPIKLGITKGNKTKKNVNGISNDLKVKKVTFSDNIPPESAFDSRLVETNDKRAESPTPSPVFEKWEKRYTGEFKKVLKDINKAVDSGVFPQFNDLSGQGKNPPQNVTKSVTFNDYVQTKFISPRPQTSSNSFIIKNDVKCFVNRTDVKVFWDAAVELHLLTPVELRKYNIRVPLEHNTRRTCLLEKHVFRNSGQNAQESMQTLEKHEFHWNGQNLRVPEEHYPAPGCSGRVENCDEICNSDEKIIGFAPNSPIIPDIPTTYNSKETPPVMHNTTNYLGSNNLGDTVQSTDSSNCNISSDHVEITKETSAVFEKIENVLTNQDVVDTKAHYSQTTNDELTEVIDKLCITTSVTNSTYQTEREEFLTIEQPKPNDATENMVEELSPEKTDDIIHQEEISTENNVLEAQINPTHQVNIEQETNLGVDKQPATLEKQSDSIELDTQNNDIGVQSISMIEKQVEPCESTKAIFKTIHEIAISLTSKEIDRNTKLKTLTKLLSTIISNEDATEDNNYPTPLQGIAIQTDSNSITMANGETVDNCMNTQTPLQAIAIQTESITVNTDEDVSSNTIANVVGDKLILDMSKFNNTEFDVQAIKDAINTKNATFNEEAVVKVLVEISSAKNQLSAEPLQENLIECLSGDKDVDKDTIEANIAKIDDTKNDMNEEEIEVNENKLEENEGNLSKQSYDEYDLNEEVKTKEKQNILLNKNTNISKVESKNKTLFKFHKSAEKSKKLHARTKPLYNISKLHENLTKKCTSAKGDDLKKPYLKSLFGDSDDEIEIVVSKDTPKDAVKINYKSYENYKNPLKTYDENCLAKPLQNVPKKSYYSENNLTELNNFETHLDKTVKDSDKKLFYKSDNENSRDDLKGPNSKKLNSHKRRHSETYNKDEFKHKLDDVKYKHIYNKFGDFLPIEQPSVKLVDYLAGKKENISTPKDPLFKSVLSKDKPKYQKHKTKHIHKLPKFEKGHHKYERKPESLATLSRNSLKSHKSRRKSLDKIEELKNNDINDTTQTLANSKDESTSSPYIFNENNEKLFGQLTNYRSDDIINFKKELKNRRKSIEQKQEATKEIYDTSDTETADESVISVATCISVKKQQCLIQVYNKNRNKSTERLVPVEELSGIQDNQKGKRKGNQSSRKRRKVNEDPLYRGQCTNIQQVNKICPYGTRQHWDLREYTLNEVIDIGRKGVLGPIESSPITSTSTSPVRRKPDNECMIKENLDIEVLRNLSKDLEINTVQNKTEDKIIEPRLCKETNDNQGYNEANFDDVEDIYHDDSSRDLVICSDESRMSDNENSLDRTNLFNLNNVTNDETNISPLLFDSNFYLSDQLNKTTKEGLEIEPIIQGDLQITNNKVISPSSTSPTLAITPDLTVNMNSTPPLTDLQNPEEACFGGTKMKKVENANDNFVESFENDVHDLKRKWDYEDDDIIYWTLVKDKYMLPPKKRCRVSAINNQTILECNYPITPQDLVNNISDNNVSVDKHKKKNVIERSQLSPEQIPTVERNNTRLFPVNDKNQLLHTQQPIVINSNNILEYPVNDVRSNKQHFRMYYPTNQQSLPATTSKVTQGSISPINYDSDVVLNYKSSTNPGELPSYNQIFGKNNRVNSFGQPSTSIQCANNKNNRTIDMEDPIQIMDDGSYKISLTEEKVLRGVPWGTSGDHRLAQQAVNGLKSRHNGAMQQQPSIKDSRGKHKRKKDVDPFKDHDLAASDLPSKKKKTSSKIHKKR